MKISNDHLTPDCASIEMTALADVHGGRLPPEDAASVQTRNNNTTNTTVTKTYTNSGADPASYCKDGLSFQGALNGKVKVKTPVGLQVEGQVSGSLTVCK